MNLFGRFLFFKTCINLYVCLFLFFVLLENFSLIWRRYHYRWRTANFDLCLAVMAIEQWGFFNMPHPLWHGPTLYTGHLRRWHVTLTPAAERLAVELSLPVLTIGLSRPGMEPRSLACEANAPTIGHHGGI